MKKALYALLALCIILPACGGDDGGSVGSMDDSSSSSGSESSSASASDSASEQASAPSAGEEAIADAIVSTLTSDPEWPFPDDAVCVAETTLDAIGLDRLVELGITVESVEDPIEEQGPETQEAFVNAVLDCVGTSGLATFLVESSNEDPEDGPPLRMEDAECIAEGLSREQWSIFLQGTIDGDQIGDDVENEFMMALLKACPQMMVNMFKDELGLDQAQAECLGGAFTDTIIEAIASGALDTGDAPPEIFEELILIFVGCGVDLE